jgi:hypothetical protein
LGFEDSIKLDRQDCSELLTDVPPEHKISALMHCVEYITDIISHETSLIGDSNTHMFSSIDDFIA